MADVPMIIVNEIGRLQRGGIDEHESALKVVEEDFVGKLLSVIEEALVQLLGLDPVALGVEEDERFTEFDVAGLVGLELADDHDAAKDKQPQKTKDETVAS